MSQPGANIAARLFFFSSYRSQCPSTQFGPWSAGDST